MRQWKLSPIDLPSRERWYNHSRARDIMLAPWHIVRSDDKKRARLNVISHFLSLIPSRLRLRRSSSCRIATRRTPVMTS